MIELFTKFADVDDVSNASFGSPVLECKRRLDVTVLPPDELPHCELIEIRLEAGANNRAGDFKHRVLLEHGPKKLNRHRNAAAFHPRYGQSSIIPIRPSGSGSCGGLGARARPATAGARAPKREATHGALFLRLFPASASSGAAGKEKGRLLQQVGTLVFLSFFTA
jgi:hypothetical protein